MDKWNMNLEEKRLFKRHEENERTPRHSRKNYLQRTQLSIVCKTYKTDICMNGAKTVAGKTAVTHCKSRQ